MESDVKCTKGTAKVVVNPIASTAFLSISIFQELEHVFGIVRDGALDVSERFQIRPEAVARVAEDEMQINAEPRNPPLAKRLRV
jgi:hypothetical protein